MFLCSFIHLFYHTLLPFTENKSKTNARTCIDIIVKRGKTMKKSEMNDKKEQETNDMPLLMSVIKDYDNMKRTIDNLLGRRFPKGDYPKNPPIDYIEIINDELSSPVFPNGAKTLLLEEILEPLEKLQRFGMVPVKYEILETQEFIGIMIGKFYGMLDVFEYYDEELHHLYYKISDLVSLTEITPEEFLKEVRKYY
jgi:hypothetical protein